MHGGRPTFIPACCFTGTNNRLAAFTHGRSEKREKTAFLSSIRKYHFLPVAGIRSFPPVFWNPHTARRSNIQAVRPLRPQREMIIVLGVSPDGKMLLPSPVIPMRRLPLRTATESHFRIAPLAINGFVRRGRLRLPQPNIHFTAMPLFASDCRKAARSLSNAGSTSFFT